ncbi:MAG: class I SAM-dependent methyltransferase [Actinomycetota bacterium]
MWGTEDLDRLLETLGHRVEQRRAAGAYPGDLERRLDEHFATLGASAAPTPAELVEALDLAFTELATFSFRRDASTESRIPGGQAAHRTVARIVGRQMDGIEAELHRYGTAVERTIGVVRLLVESIARSYEQDLAQRVDDAHDLLAEQSARLNAVESRLEDLAARVPGAPRTTWYRSDAFVDAFRGGTEAVRDRYRDLVGHFAGCSPVLEVGFGRGEVLELLGEAGIEASGIEPDPGLVDAARARGLRVETGTALEYLADLPDASLGGLVMIQVVEHLPPQGVIDVVRLAAEKVRPGGRVVFETVNPTALSTYANAFWVDPDHVRPVHPAFLAFLFREAGFAEVERVDRSVLPPAERLQSPTGADPVVAANFARVDELLFGPQDYAIVATR